MDDMTLETTPASLENATGVARVFTLPSAVTIQNIEEVAQQLKALQLAQGEMLVLDAMQTEIITTPGIQLILALSKTLEQNGNSLAIMKPRESFNQSFDALGLASQLSQWEESNG